MHIFPTCTYIIRNVIFEIICSAQLRLLAVNLGIRGRDRDYGQNQAVCSCEQRKQQQQPSIIIEKEPTTSLLIVE